MFCKVIKIKIDSTIYKDNVVFKVVDIIANEYTTKVEKKGRYYLLKIAPKYKEKIEPKKIESQFFEHLNNQMIRNKIYKETHAIRELIVGKALFETEAFDNAVKFFDINKYSDSDNYILDLENIAKPFNTNYGKKSTR